MAILFKWLFTILAFWWLYRVLRPWILPDQAVMPPPEPPVEQEVSVPENRLDKTGEYIDYEDIE